MDSTRGWPAKIRPTSYPYLGENETRTLGKDTVDLPKDQVCAGAKRGARGGQV